MSFQQPMKIAGQLNYAPVCFRLYAIERWYDLGFSRSRS